MAFTKERIAFITACVENAVKLFNSEYDAIEYELRKFEEGL